MSFPKIVFLNRHGQVTQTCDSKHGHHWSRLWLVAKSAPGHYMNQCSLIVNWTNWKQNSVKIVTRQKHVHARKLMCKSVCYMVTIIGSLDVWNCHLRLTSLIFEYRKPQDMRHPIARKNRLETAYWILMAKSPTNGKMWNISIILRMYHAIWCLLEPTGWQVYSLVVAKITTKPHACRAVITLTSQWVPWRLKSPASRLFAQTVSKGAHQRKTSKLRVTGLCHGNPPVTGGFP